MDVNKILNGLSASGVLSSVAGGMAGGVLTSALSGKRGQLGTLVKAGGLAAVAGLAWRAWQQHQQAGQELKPLPQNAAAAAIEAPVEAPVERLANGSSPMLLLRCMIAAAMADGHIDSQETHRIFNRLDTLDLGQDDKALILDELRSPASIDDLAAQVHDLHTATEVYLAAVLAIDSTCPKGQEWLASLARRLELPPLLVERLHQVPATKTSG